MRLACLTAALTALAFGPAVAETSAVAILAPMTMGSPGPATTLVLAEQLVRYGITNGDPLPLITAVALTRDISTREAAGWRKETSGTALAGQSAGNAVAAPMAPDPSVIADLAARLTADDPRLLDLLADIEAQRPDPQITSVTRARSDLAAGQTDEWRLVFFGASYAEIAVIGDGDGNLDLSVTDETGAQICSDRTTGDLMLCRFVPARNGFFSVRVSNTGPAIDSYLLITN